MDTFQQHEPETIDYMSRFCMIKPVDPLFINPNTSIRGDFLKPDEWLNSKPQASIVYISFGSLAHIGQKPESLMMLVWLIRFNMLISLETSPFKTLTAASSPIKDPL
jgi:hypothetical protein